MKPPPEEDFLPTAIADAIRSLPAAAAGPGFHAKVLARAAAASTRRRTLRRRGFSLAASLGIVVLGFGLGSYEAAQNRTARQAALIAEHRRLLGDLAALRELADRRALISLGGDASADIYLDLSTVPALAAAEPAVPQTRRPG